MTIRNPFRRKPRPAGIDTEIWRAVARHPKAIVKPPSLLTPNDIRDQVFATTRWHEGYDMDQVDDFLDQARITIGRLTATIHSLQKERAQ